MKLRMIRRKGKAIFVKKKPKLARCGNCGEPLKGVLRGGNVKMRNSPKTKKRPERKYGGVLCSKCMRERIREGVRKNVQQG